MVLSAAAGFGTIAIFGKLGVDAGLNNATMLAFRFAIATVILVGFLGLRGLAVAPTRRQLLVAVGLGATYAVLTGAFFWGLLYVTAGLAVITLYTYPIYVFAISVAVLGERITARKLVALVLAIAGVVLIVGLDTAGFDAAGVALVSVAAVAYAVYTTGNRFAVGDIGAERLAAVAMGTSAVAFVGYGLASGRLFLPDAAAQWGVIAGLATLGTAVPIVLFAHGLRRIEASRASVLTTLEPPVAVTLGVVVLGEALSPGILVGGILVLAGITFIQRERAVARPPADAPDGA